MTPKLKSWGGMAGLSSQAVSPTLGRPNLTALPPSGTASDALLLDANFAMSCVAKRDLVLGRPVRDVIVQGGYEANTYMANHMLRMYASKGRLEEARRVFNMVATPNCHMWSSIILAHARQGHAVEAIQLYRQMRDTSVQPDNHVFVAVLKACATAEDLASGKEIHAGILEGEVKPNIFVANCLVNMYSKCRSLEDARRVFDNLAMRDVVTWNAMIGGYAQQGFGEEALAVYAIMQQEGIVPPNHITFVCILQACASIGALHQGKQIHAEIRRARVESCVLVGNSLINMYAKCGSLKDARRVFDRLQGRDVVTWNAMFAGYAQHSLGQEALALYANMEMEGIIFPDPVTFVCLLQACASVQNGHRGKQLHAEIQQRGLATDLVVGNCLVDMYAKCGSLEDAQMVFDKLPKRDVVTWNALMAGYARKGLIEEALALYVSMQQEGISVANHVTFVCLLQACTSVRAVEQLHVQIQETGLETDVAVGSCLVDMYAKCGSLGEARRVFDRLPVRDAVTWTAMLAGHVEHGLGQEALALYATMQYEDISPTDHTFVCLVKACASVGALFAGKKLHAQIQERGLEANVIVANCLVDMYGKLGRLEDARSVFNSLPRRDVVTWNALLNGYAENSNGEMAIHCFEEMRLQGVEPNDSTFICLFVACSHAGLVGEGCQYFKMMVNQYGIAPTVHHYNCMVDLLGRSGRLDEAESMLQTMPFQDHVVAWTSLLTACKSYGDVDRGRRCFNHLVELEPGNASAYVLLSNIYANAGRWEDAHNIDSLRKCAGAQKKLAKACIEVANKVFEFTVGEEGADISSKVRSLNSELKKLGHVPQTELVLKAVSEQEKEYALCGHAEKLALAYGLINTPKGTTLLVTKNLRMCNDCHSSTKILSNFEKREIIVRDAHRVHRFLNGDCSCGDGD